MAEAAVGYRHGAATLAREWHAEICRLYDEVFAAPPFAWHEGDSEQHAALLRDLGAVEGFAITVAVAGGELAGFAYGHPLPVDHRWWEDLERPLPEDFRREWPGRTFTLVDFAVRPELRGRGVGKRLLDILLADRPEQRAVLSVQPAAAGTRAIYGRLGWRELCVKGPIGAPAPAYWVIMVRSLTADRADPLE